VIEIRKNNKGEEFIVETIMESESRELLIKYLETEGNHLMVDKKFRVKAIDLKELKG